MNSILDQAYQILSQFAAVELSAIYHDAIKDRLYTDPANSQRRRSTQTALQKLATSLCQMLSPIMVFTADEAWEYIPEISAELLVDLSLWQPTELSQIEDEFCRRWNNLIGIRMIVLPYLETSRKSGVIGKSLDADLIIKGTNVEASQVAQQYTEDLRELLNVSHLKIEIVGAGDPPKGFIQDVVSKKADGQKCERCWHWETDVGSNPEHPTICARCVAAVKEFSGKNL